MLIYTHTNISSGVFRGPGGRGPWPNPNANSVSATSNHFSIAITERNNFIISLLPTDSILIFITRKLCGELHAQDFVSPSLCLSEMFFVSNHFLCSSCRGLQEVAALQELPSCQAQEVSLLSFNLSEFHVSLLSLKGHNNSWGITSVTGNYDLKRKALVLGNVIWIHQIAENFPVKL